MINISANHDAVTVALAEVATDGDDMLRILGELHRLTGVGPA